MLKYYFILAILFSGLLREAGAEDPIYIGVTGCAGSSCHRGAAAKGSNIVGNEFVTWKAHDSHSSAFLVLTKELARNIGQRLGVEDPASSPRCLSCHSTFAEVNERGAKFSLSHGVGCESCHGAAGPWIEKHKTGLSHSENVASGMTNLADPGTRVRVCLDCHIGTKENNVTHQMLSAGHPRLRFELESYTWQGQAHYLRDEDYHQRKQPAHGVVQFAIGTVVASMRSLEIAAAHSGLKNRFPEFSNYECHSCHHATGNKRGKLAEIEQGYAPGALRMNDAHLSVVFPISRWVDEELHVSLEKAVKKLHTKVGKNGNADADLVAQIILLLNSLETKLQKKTISDEEIESLLVGYLQQFARGNYRDYTSAEQAFLAVQNLVIELGQYDNYADLLVELYESLTDEYGYTSGGIVRASRKLLDHVKG